MYVPEAGGGRWSVETDDHAMGRAVGNHDVKLGKGAKTVELWRLSALLEICQKDVEGTDDEIGRDRRELQEPLGECDFAHS